MRHRELLAVLLAFGAVQASAGGFAGHFEVTAYCSCPLCCGKGARGITASGCQVERGVVAADWKILPPGTKIALSCFPSQVFTVLDTGSAIKGRRIDVWMPSHDTAVQFGRHKAVRTEVLGSARDVALRGSHWTASLSSPAHPPRGTASVF